MYHKFTKKTFFYFFIGALLLATGVLLAFFLQNPQEASGRQKVEFIKNDAGKIAQVAVNGKTFDVELAETPEEKSTGLMYRETLAENAGMLFIYDKEGNYRFWMKNTLIPLDMVWINSDLEVVHVAKSVPPCKTPACPSYGGSEPSMYILEVNAGAF